MRSKKKALTLIEVLLVIAFLGIALFPILEMFSRSLLISTESELALKAVSLANRTMEEEKAISYSSLVSSAKAAEPTNPTFNREINVQTVAENLKQVEVIIYYPVGTSELSLSLKTLVANY